MVGGFFLKAQTYQDSLQQVLSQSIPTHQKLELYFQLGEYLVQRNPELSERYADTCVQILQSTDLYSDENKARVNYIYAASHRWQGNYKQALELYKRNYDYYKKKNDSINIAKSGKKLASINMFLGNNIICQEYLLECADIYNKIGTPAEKASIQSSLASFYLNIDQLEDGLNGYLKALDAFAAINDSAGMANTNANLGYVYSELGDFEKAEMHLLKQKSLNNVFPTLREMGFHHDFMGVLKQKQGLIKEAYQEHLKALEIRQNLSSTYNLCESLLNTGEVLIKLGRYEEAILLLSQVLDYEEHESLNQQSAAYELLSLAHEKNGNNQKALQYYKSYKVIDDSILNKESIEVIAEKDAKFESQEKDAEISLLNKQNEVNEGKIRQSRILFYGSLIVLFLISAFTYILYRVYKKIKHKNSIIETTLNDKNLLIKEIHHRVKNNLQIISSLLKLQSRFVKDQNALDAIQAGRSRVQSMALLHQNLYRDDNITGINMADYFENLISGIFQSYKVGEDQIKYKIDVDHILLDVDTVIPIGLITNELITNCIKYAFQNHSKDALIVIELKAYPTEYILAVKDNGIGIDESIVNQSSATSFGQKMIQAFVDKMDGKLHIEINNGTNVIINIPKDNIGL